MVAFTFWFLGGPWVLGTSTSYWQSLWPIANSPLTSPLSTKREKNHGPGAKVNPHHQSSEAPITYQQVEYLEHMARHYHWADLVVCRGGASTISELRAVKTAALIAPIYFHADQHQVHNAQALKAEADFPVHVLSQEELRVGGHKELQHLIIKQYNRGQRDVPHGGMAEENNPTTLIVQAVLSSV